MLYSRWGHGCLYIIPHSHLKSTTGLNQVRGSRVEPEVKNVVKWFHVQIFLFHWATPTVQAKEHSSLPNPPKSHIKTRAWSFVTTQKREQHHPSSLAWYKSQILTTEYIQMAFQWWSPVCPATQPALEDSSSVVQRSWSTPLPGPQQSHLLWVQKERFLTEPHCPELSHIRLTQPHQNTSTSRAVAVFRPANP